VLFNDFSQRGPTASGAVAVVRAENGSVRWIRYLHTLNNVSVSTLLLALAVADSVIIAASADGMLTAFNIADGSTRWTRRDVRVQIDLRPAIGCGGVAYVGSTDGSIVALRATSGTTIWEARGTFGGIAELFCDNRFVYATYGGQQLSVYDAATGKLAWEIREQLAGFELLIDTDRVYTGAARGPRGLRSFRK
jgi:outer membrane protein assembly factor BamB